LFSKRQTAFSILFTSISSLAVNLFFKFLAPELLNISLGRMGETVLGVFLPLALLLFFELFNRKKQFPNHLEIPVDEIAVDTENQEVIESNTSNQQSKAAIRTVGYALLGVGSMIFILGLISSVGRISVLSVSSVILALGSWAVFVAREKKG